MIQLVLWINQPRIQSKSGLFNTGNNKYSSSLRHFKLSFQLLPKASNWNRLWTWLSLELDCSTQMHTCACLRPQELLWFGPRPLLLSPNSSSPTPPSASHYRPEAEHLGPFHTVLAFWELGALPPLGKWAKERKRSFLLGIHYAPCQVNLDNTKLGQRNEAMSVWYACRGTRDIQCPRKMSVSHFCSLKSCQAPP